MGSVRGNASGDEESLGTVILGWVLECFSFFVGRVGKRTYQGCATGRP
jgi:hypothetical protein